MRLDRLSIALAAVSGLMSLIALVYGLYTLSTIPADPPGDGFAHGLAEGFAIGATFVGVLTALSVTNLLRERRQTMDRRRRVLLWVGCVFCTVGTVAFVGSLLVPAVGSFTVVLSSAGVVFVGWAVSMLTEYTLWAERHDPDVV
ncbi:hypothetical protein [Haloprofundus halophilus]|uniref:hypothetical protein n=1 Tax=Haloprofundus halophilus TaxID=2283527 RepID=UPI000E451DE3|nr:hypothetical protein [Haloprofundus halophilus]